MPAGAEIITVAIRRVNIGQDPNAPSLLDVLPPTEYTILPNTAGCYNAKDAVYTLQTGARAAGRAQAGQARSAGRREDPVPAHARNPDGGRSAGARTAST